MLPEVGASELIVLAAVALIVVGPKDLPVLLRRIGQFIAKMRGFAADFRSSFDEMARQSELDELRKEVEALRNTQFTDTLGPIPTWDETHHALQPTDEPPVVASPDDPELASDFEAHAGSSGPSILPPASEPAPAKPKRARKPKAAPAPEEPA
jgi:sec-independent protein translocase protein TatB